MKAFYEMTEEEIRKERAGKVEYYEYEGHLVKKQWNDTGDRFYIFGYKNNQWIPDWPSAYTVDFEAVRLDDTDIQRFFNL